MAQNAAIRNPGLMDTSINEDMHPARDIREYVLIPPIRSSLLPSSL